MNPCRYCCWSTVASTRPSLIAWIVVASMSKEAMAIFPASLSSRIILIAGMAPSGPSVNRALVSGFAFRKARIVDSDLVGSWVVSSVSTFAPRSSVNTSRMPRAAGVPVGLADRRRVAHRDGDAGGPSADRRAGHVHLSRDVPRRRPLEHCLHPQHLARVVHALVDDRREGVAGAGVRDDEE